MLGDEKGLAFVHVVANVGPDERTYFLYDRRGGCSLADRSMPVKREILRYA
jgi:hypothetical protein